MGFIERDYKVDIMHIGTSNLITNYGILCLLEDIATVHSDIAGYGIAQIPFTHVSWILLNWKVSVFKRVAFGDMVKVKTWSVPYNELFTYRNFEIYDNTLLMDDEEMNATSMVDSKDATEEPLYNEIVEFVVTQGKASASLLQRRFRLGYNRAARAIDLLEERGIVGPSNGSKPREVLVKIEPKNNDEDE